MSFKIKNKEVVPTSSYGNTSQGIDEIYLKRDEKENHIFTNRLALGGGWINSQQLEDLARILGLKLINGDNLVVKSYKLRSLNKDGKPKSSADCTWSIEIE